MTYKIEHVLSYLQESTYAQNTILAGTQTYHLGHFFENQILPAPQVGMTRYSNLDDRDASHLAPGRFPMKSTLKFYLINGIPLYLAMGQSANTNPSYWQHVITGVYAAGSDKFDMPSFTLHHELKDGSTLIREYFGNKISRCQLSAQRGGPVICDLDLMASKIVASGNELTTPPIFPATANQKPFRFDSSTITWDGVTYVNLQSVNIGIGNALEGIFVHRTSDEEFARFIFEGDRTYMLNLNILIQDNTFLIDRVLDQIPKNFSLLFTRGTNDTINFAFTGCQVTDQKDVFKVREGNILVPAVIVPKTLTITVQDQIPGTFYPTQS
jgi:hypothetical protein